MPTHRIKRIEAASIADQFSTYSVSTTLDLFEGDPSVKSLIADYIRQQVEDAKKEGALEAVSRINSEVGKAIDNYVLLVTKIVDTVKEAASNQFAPQDLIITDSRTNFDFATRMIKILFVIDADFEKEFLFSGLINEVEQFVFKKENFLSEILYINKRGSTVDSAAVCEDYPFSRKSA